MAHFVIKQGDNFPHVRAQISQEDMSQVSLGSATVRFLMTSQNGVRQVEGTADIIDDANGIVEYQWQDGNTDIHGNYKAEFEITYGDGRKTTVPADKYIIVSITKQAE